MGEVLAFNRLPLRAIVARSEAGKLLSGQRYSFLVGELVAGRAPPDKTSYGFKSAAEALSCGRYLAREAGLPLVDQTAVATAPPPVAA